MPSDAIVVGIGDRMSRAASLAFGHPCVVAATGRTPCVPDDASVCVAAGARIVTVPELGGAVR